MKKITNLEVCNFLITINRPAQTRNFHGPPECNGGPAGGTLARTAGLFYGRPEWATLVGQSSTTILSYVAIFAIAGAMEPWQHHFFRQRNTEWLRVTGAPTRPSATPTACTWIGHANVDRARFFQVHALVEHISSRSATCLHKTEVERKRTRSILQSSFFFERKNEKARERERESVCARASMTGESSRACFSCSWLRFIAERNLPSQSSTELEQKSKRTRFILHRSFFFERKTLRGLQWRERVVEKI